MFDFITYAFIYVVSDQYFWPAMALTTMTSLFIGAVIYNGDIDDAKRGLFSIASYACLLTLVTSARVLNNITPLSSKHQPLAGLITIFCVSVFYIFGMYLGVKIVKSAINRHR